MEIKSNPNQQWIAIAIPEDEARAAFNACTATFMQLVALGATKEPGGPELARAMARLAMAIDRDTGKEN